MHRFDGQPKTRQERNRSDRSGTVCLNWGHQRLKRLSVQTTCKSKKSRSRAHKAAAKQQLHQLQPNDPNLLVHGVFLKLGTPKSLDYEEWFMLVIWGWWCWCFTNLWALRNYLLLLGASPCPIAYDHVLHVGTVPGRWSHVAEAIQMMKSVGEDGWSSMKHCHFLIVRGQLKGTSSHSASEPCCCWCPQCVFHVSSAEGWPACESQCVEPNRV